jgi:putative membrane protein
MAIVASVFVSLAAVVHLAVFASQTIGWSSPSVWRRYGVASQRDAEVTRPLAYTQGFHNLFLAGGAIVGLVLYWTTLRHVGFGLMFFTCTCMVLAAVVQLTVGGRKPVAALVQGLPPLVGLVLFVVAQAG